MEPACGLLLISDLSSDSSEGLGGRPSTVQDGSSGCALVSDKRCVCLVRHRGVVSAGVASAPIIRKDGGKMETGERKREIT